MPPRYMLPLFSEEENKERSDSRTFMKYAQFTCITAIIGAFVALVGYFVEDFTAAEGNTVQDIGLIWKPIVVVCCLVAVRNFIYTARKSRRSSRLARPILGSTILVMAGLGLNTWLLFTNHSVQACRDSYYYCERPLNWWLVVGSGATILFTIVTMVFVEIWQEKMFQEVVEREGLQRFTPPPS